MNVCCKLYISGKILVYSGAISEGYAEVIDLLNPRSNCDIFSKMPIELSQAFGGKVMDDYIVCGGQEPKFGPIRDECYKVGTNTSFLKLSKPKYCGATVVLPNNTLFLTGRSKLSILHYRIAMYKRLSF